MIRTKIIQTYDLECQYDCTQSLFCAHSIDKETMKDYVPYVTCIYDDETKHFVFSCCDFQERL